DQQDRQHDADDPRDDGAAAEQGVSEPAPTECAEGPQDDRPDDPDVLLAPHEQTSQGAEDRAENEKSDEGTHLCPTFRVGSDARKRPTTVGTPHPGTSYVTSVTPSAPVPPLATSAEECHERDDDRHRDDGRDEDGVTDHRDGP